MARQITKATLNAQLLQAQYAVRGPIVAKAAAHEAALNRGESRPFSKVIWCNIGNPQILEQKPITFHRQVLALLAHPPLIEEAPEGLFPADAVDRAKMYLKEIVGGTGAYSESQGVAVVRKEVADFLERRDGCPAHASTVFLTDGASPGVQMLLSAVIRDERDGILVPVPQYPLYSASIAMFGGKFVGYHTDESTNWGLDMDSLKTALDKARADGINVRGLTVINPGNPTGGCLSVENQRDVVSFCVDNNLMLMADEVYQENVWAAGKSFTSFKKVAGDMGLVPDDPHGFNGLQLASFHSVSKGFLGECGRRGGYFEVVGVDEEVCAQLYKKASVSLCPNIMGQVMVGLMVNPPKEGDASFPLYKTERDTILSSLKRRAAKLSAAYAGLEGISCEAPEGALYIFPRIELPPKAIEEAEATGVAPDALYCNQLLDATGVVVVPGSGFGQKDGTYHFRTTILPPEAQVDAVVESFKHFHEEFMAKYK